MGAFKISARDRAQTCTWLTYEPTCNIKASSKWSKTMVSVPDILLCLQVET